jgi:hypothetical protein
MITDPSSTVRLPAPSADSDVPVAGRETEGATS